MYTLKSSGEFFKEIRALDPLLKNIRLHSIEIGKRDYTITYNFICDEYIDDALKEKVMDVVNKNAPSEFRFVNISIEKIVTDGELVASAIYKFVKANFPSASIFLKPTDVICVALGETVKYTLRLPSASADYMSQGGGINKINEFLSKNFCSDFAGCVEIKEDEEIVDLTVEDVFVNELTKVELRTIRVKDVVVIEDKSIGDVALYIEDLVEDTPSVICGKITEIFERQTQRGKPYLVLHLTDTTGSVSGLCFAKKFSWDRIRQLQVGDEIIASGKLSTYNGRTSFTFDRINRCTFPPDFVKQDKFKKQPPKEYSLVFPTEVSTMKVKSVFDADLELPDNVVETEYVVFDLETTGLEVTSNGITEIGAVKIKNGKVVEEFTTLVKPDYPITDKIVELTGITPEMVENSPRIGAVIPDFIKFIQGTTLVAHNAEFDMKFIKRFATSEEYDISNPVIDTVEVARRTLTNLRRHDLHTLGEYFNVKFHHHRALSDAYATAEIFLELMKLSGGK